MSTLLAGRDGRRPPAVCDAIDGAIGDAPGRPGPRRVMRWVTGTLLVGLGARVALERS